MDKQTAQTDAVSFEHAKKPMSGLFSLNYKQVRSLLGTQTNLDPAPKPTQQ